MSNSFVLSLGGSVVSCSTGINTDFLKKFKKVIEERVASGDKFIIVVGGGVNARNGIRDVLRVVPRVDAVNLDWVGISATKFNATIVKSIFGNLADKNLVADPKVKIKRNKPLLFSGGHLPGSSSDFVSAVLAKTYGIKKIINISNIDYVYDRDPKKYQDAQKITEISWGDFLEIVGDHWEPGLNIPFDPLASKLCRRENKEVVVLNGNNLLNLKKCLSGEKFRGTKIYGK